jgi:phage-related protein
MPKIISAVIDALIQCLPQLIDGAIDLVLGLVEHLPEIIFGIIEAVPTIIVKVGEALVKAAPKLIQGAITLVAKLVEKIPEIIKRLLEKVPEIISKIAAKLSEGLSKIVEAGKNIVKGLWEGITGAAKWLWDKIKGWLSGLWGNILGFFGIHSPSTKARDILGKNLVKGLAQGVLDEGKTAVDAMNSVAEDILGVKFKTPKIDISGLSAAYGNAVADVAGTISVTGGAARGRSAAPVYNVQFKFGDVTINNDNDIETLAGKLSGYLYEDVMTKGGAFA